ncbi:MAG: LPXTG cell wall anchor domain-containing protein [Actinomyces sp.]|uniref:LPXTG cell wall anchor domain-containing protein n=1 Tax=Actinomyces sp. TaxID=29317 RepID=UPI00290464AC|nr:LPXTG cell wall anchor domain-containing protein [Actinomyces sp.]MDU1431483.1 LPXTG cell wall anchor domain-containing protein [Actinomyces sp.]
MRLSKKLVIAALGSATLVINPLVAFAAGPTIEDTEGPLVRIAISDTLNCSINYKGDRYNEFYNGYSTTDPADCGTFLAVGSELFGPGVLKSRSAKSMGTIAWTPVSQTKSGMGTQADPWVLTTVVRGGGFEITQTDTYSTGNDFYATTTSVKNVSGAAQDFTLYHAADCYLQDDDYGFGEYDANTGTVICRAKDPETGEHSDRGRVEQFVPTTAGSNYYYGAFYQVWDKVENRTPLPNKLERADSNRDNGMALSWTRTLEPNATVDYSLVTSFSPKGQVALSSATCAVAQPGADSTATRTIGVTITNPNRDVKSVQTVIATLSDDATYVPQSVSGAPEPTVAGKVLTFKNLELPANGSVKFSFLIAGSAEVTPLVKISGTTTSGAAIVESDTSQSSTCDFPELPTPGQSQPTPGQSQPTPGQSQPTPGQSQPTAEQSQSTPEQAQPTGGKSTEGNKLARTGANTGVAIALVGLLGVAGVGLVAARRRAH